MEILFYEDGYEQMSIEEFCHFIIDNVKNRISLEIISGYPQRMVITMYKYTITNEYYATILCNHEEYEKLLCIINFNNKP